ncbi:sulfurtransferase TusA family protein [Pseudochelatococcus sp. B33]
MGGGAAETIALDLCGLKCPLPALRTRKALARAVPGAVLTVTCTDPLAVVDIPHLVSETGHRLEASTSDGRVLTFVIRVAPGA